MKSVLMDKITGKFVRLFWVGAVLAGLAGLLVTETIWIRQKTLANREIKSNYTVGMSQIAPVVMGKESIVPDGAKVEEVATTDDARPVLIRKYLTKYQSPLLPYSDLIFKLSQEYGFDYYWIIAIAQQESNLCKSIPQDSHNCWGYGINSAGTLRFDSYELALKSYAEYLKREYFDKGLNTPELMMRKYCPHSNGSWAYGVNQFIKEIDSGSF